MVTIMDRIIDIHTHILPGVDDGSKSIDESIEIIKYLYSIGVTDIVLTSHYIKDTKYVANLKERKAIYEKLVKENIKGVNLYLGNEVFLNDDVINLFNKKEITTINNSNYMLVELPLTSYMNGYSNILCDLSEYGIIPIIAHPERYEFIKKDKKKVKELLEFNTLLQVNVESLTGKYGKKAKKVAKWLLKKDLVSFVATDIHRVSNKTEIDKAYKKLKKLVKKDRYIELTYNNPLRVLNNKRIKRNMDCIRENSF